MYPLLKTAFTELWITFSDYKWRSQSCQQNPLREFRSHRAFARLCHFAWSHWNLFYIYSSFSFSQELFLHKMFYPNLIHHGSWLIMPACFRRNKNRSSSKNWTHSMTQQVTKSLSLLYPHWMMFLLKTMRWNYFVNGGLAVRSITMACGYWFELMIIK